MECIVSRRIPPELPTTVIGLLRGDNPTLKACSLTCRTWRSLAQRVLLHQILIRDGRVLGDFNTSAREHPTLIAYVRELRITREADGSDLVETLRLFRDLTSLELVTLHISCRTAATDLPQKDLPRAWIEELLDVIVQMNLQKLRIINTPLKPVGTSLGSHALIDPPTSVTGLSRLELLEATTSVDDAASLIIAAAAEAQKAIEVPTLRRFFTKLDHFLGDDIAPLSSTVTLLPSSSLCHLRLGLGIGISLGTDASGSLFCILLTCSNFYSQAITQPPYSAFGDQNWPSLTKLEFTFYFGPPWHDIPVEFSILPVVSAIINRISTTAPLRSLSLIIYLMSDLKGGEEQPLLTSAMDTLDRAICNLPHLEEFTLCFPTQAVPIGSYDFKDTLEEGKKALKDGIEYMVDRLQGTREKIGISLVPSTTFV